MRGDSPCLSRTLGSFLDASTKMAPLELQYSNTLDDWVYDYTSFFNAPEGTPEVSPGNYQMPQQAARPHRRRHPERYTPAPRMSSGSTQF
ncbi:hypothetical protein PVK06_022614 [Gossypium arboreum]|uniref:Uncharacterized protein n=1 Tax=Gossypium arboreum TaxID=29729 RepID=A0ABR0P8V0_GOSAR|nr:hypothetical protein PVK06_022614 [Gossypium arboreum]